MQHTRNQVHNIEMKIRYCFYWIYEKNKGNHKLQSSLRRDGTTLMRPYYYIMKIIVNDLNYNIGYWILKCGLTQYHIPSYDKKLCNNHIIFKFQTVLYYTIFTNTILYNTTLYPMILHNNVSNFISYGKI